MRTNYKLLYLISVLNIILYTYWALNTIFTKDLYNDFWEIAYGGLRVILNIIFLYIIYRDSIGEESYCKCNVKGMGVAREQLIIIIPLLIILHLAGIYAVMYNQKLGVAYKLTWDRAKPIWDSIWVVLFTISYINYLM